MAQARLSFAFDTLPSALFLMPDRSMTVTDEELLISRPPQYQPRRVPAPPSIRIECQAEERHFFNQPPTKINTSVKPIRFTVDEQIKPGKYRSEILVHNNPDLNFYIKRLRVAFHAHDDSAICSSKRTRSSSRSHSLNARSSGKSRPVSLPRSSSQALLHQWIDDICSNEKLMANDDICFFIRNGEFLARI